MRRVVIESPYAGDITRNVYYARLCILDSLRRGEAPIASHLLYTQPGILDDDNPEERQWGIDAGLAWVGVADAQVFYLDLGASHGMCKAYNTRGAMDFEVRYLGKCAHDLWHRFLAFDEGRS